MKKLFNCILLACGLVFGLINISLAYKCKSSTCKIVNNQCTGHQKGLWKDDFHTGCNYPDCEPKYDYSSGKAMIISCT